SKKGCFKCGNLGHLADSCPSVTRLCYNCRESGHESADCPSPKSASARQCYGCGGVGHLQSECPSVRISKHSGKENAGTCGRLGHIARACPIANLGDSNGIADFATRGGFRSGEGGNHVVPIKCFRCNPLNHFPR
ncbi:hypothetical protein BS47DRAFT_1262412, partial [Hydnum rufescens UP504]